MGDLCDLFLRLSLLGESPTVQDRTERHKLRKSLCRREADGGCGARLGRTHFAAQLMENRRTTQGKTQAQGVRNLLRQRHRLVVPCQSLVRIAQEPQRSRVMAVTSHA